MIRERLKGLVTKSLPDPNAWQTIVAIILNEESGTENTIKNIAMTSLQTQEEVAISLRGLMRSGFRIKKTKAQNLMIEIAGKDILIRVAKQQPKKTGSMEMFVDTGSTNNGTTTPEEGSGTEPRNEDMDDLILSIMSKDLTRIEEIINNKEIDFNYANINGESVLSASCKKNDINILTKLIKFGLPAQDGLMWACQNGNKYKGLIQFFIKHGASANLGDGLAPLQWAIFTGAIGIAQELISGGANVNYKSKTGESILQMAVDSDNEQLVELLIINDVDLSVRDANNNAPLHWAVMTGATDIIKMLIFNKAEMDAENLDGKTPLQLAVTLGQDKAETILRKY